MKDDFSNFLMSLIGFECVDVWSSRISLRMFEEDEGRSLFLCCRIALWDREFISLPLMMYLIWPKMRFPIFEFLFSYSSSSKLKLEYSKIFVINSCSVIFVKLPHTKEMVIGHPRKNDSISSKRRYRLAQKSLPIAQTWETWEEKFLGHREVGVFKLLTTWMSDDPSQENPMLKRPL